MASIIYRGWEWLSEQVVLDNDNDELNARVARADALMRTWSVLRHEDEQVHFARLNRDEDDYPYGDDEDDEPEATPAVDLSAELREAQMDYIERQLEDIGCRPMRAYEHWNEDERYMQYQEEGRFGHFTR